MNLNGSLILFMPPYIFYGDIMNQEEYEKLRSIKSKLCVGDGYTLRIPCDNCHICREFNVLFPELIR